MLPLLAWGINTIATGFKATPSTVVAISPSHSPSSYKKIENTGSKTYFIPTKTANEWSAFLANMPADLQGCNIQYQNSCGGSACVNAGSYDCVGSCTGTSNKTAGTDTGTCRECDGAGSEQAPADDTACGTVDCDGLDNTYESGSDSATGTNYCYFDNYSDITSNRCEGLGDCKDANTADCGSASTSTVATCGTCQYVSTCASGSGSCSNYASGTDTGTCRECDGAGGEQAPADDTACGTIDCDGNNYYYISGTASATSTNYTYYRDYADLTSSRCEGLGNCKDANTGDCTSYSNNLTASCGTCEYASGDSGGCNDYNSSTVCSSTSCNSNNYYYASGSASATGTNYIYYRDYNSATIYCNGAGSCSNYSCSSYSDSLQTSCSTCQYASGGSSSCYNYNSSTSCGTGDCDYLNDYYISGSASPTGTNYVYYRDYQDATRYCNGSGSCGGTSCTSYSDSLQASCGTCEYASGTYCAAYTSGTSCGSGYECDGNGNCVAASPCAGQSNGTSCGTNKACLNEVCKPTYGCGSYSSYPSQACYNNVSGSWEGAAYEYPRYLDTNECEWCGARSSQVNLCCVYDPSDPAPDCPFYEYTCDGIVP